VSDIALTWSQPHGSADFAVSANDFVGEDGLRSSVITSLFCDAPAQAGDELPDGSIAKGGEGGWWADAVPAVPNDAFGSRLWLLRRAKRLAVTLTRAQAYGFEALQWLVPDKIASAVGVSASYNAKGWLVLEVTIDRPNQSRATFRFDPVWQAEASR
jgi:phage gp46-like protein